MMDLSFVWPHPRFPTPIGSVSVRLHTFENVYGIDPDSMSIESSEGVTRIHAGRLSWAGGQQTADGSMWVEIVATGTSATVRIGAEHPDGIRSLGLTIHDLPTAAVSGVREGQLEVPDSGRIVRYPNGWFDLASPIIRLAEAERSLTIRSLDDRPRPKTFALLPHFEDTETMDVDLLVEAEATRPSTRFEAPAWVLEAEAPGRASAMVAHRDHIERVYPVDPWETRADVPGWAREISLVVTLHGRHYTGRVFNDYARMLAHLRRIAGMLEGRRVLAYLPGWEGRYYRHYGRYDTDPVMGGADGFRALVDGAHELGMRVMPMFGANVAARDLPGFARWGEPGVLRRPSGLSDAGSVDWDASRHYDHDGALINPAFAPWRAHLVAQIAELRERFGFDASFLDITAMHANDPNGDTTAGLRALVDELHAAAPRHLVAGEGWFDAIAGIVPLVQTGHHDNVPVFHDQPDEELFSRTSRTFGHVNLGDPAHGSSGVHEAGRVAAWRLPVRRAVIPTLGLVEDTLDQAPHRVGMILDDAREYADRHLPVPARGV